MKQLPAGRTGPRTRLYVLGEWETPVYDSDTSDMHPHDFLLYGPHTELTVVIDQGTGSWHMRWSGTWTQVSRRKFTEHNYADLLKYLTWPQIQPLPTIAAPTYEEQRRLLRYQPISEFLASCGIEDAALTIANPFRRISDGR